MKTIINCGDEKLHISNDDVEGYNYLELWFEDENKETTESIIVNHDELMAAIIGFDALRSRQPEISGMETE